MSLFENDLQEDVDASPEFYEAVPVLCQRLAEARAEAAGLRAVHTVQSDIIVAVTAERDEAQVAVRELCEMLRAVLQMRDDAQVVRIGYGPQHDPWPAWTKRARAALAKYGSDS